MIQHHPEGRRKVENIVTAPLEILFQPITNCMYFSCPSNERNLLVDGVQTERKKQNLVLSPLPPPTIPPSHISAFTSLLIDLYIRDKLKRDCNYNQENLL